MHKLIKTIIINILTIGTLCITMQAKSAVLTYTPMLPPVQEEKSLFDGAYIGIGAGVVDVNAETKNIYKGGFEDLKGWYMFEDFSNKSSNLGKYGFGGSIFVGLGKVFNTSYYFGGELFANYFSPKIKAYHEDILTGTLTPEGQPLVPFDFTLMTDTQIKNEYSFGGDVRLGYLVSPKIMIYGLFGIDYSKFKVKVNEKITIHGDHISELDVTNKFETNKVGYIPGIGIETALGDGNNMSLRAQYTHTLYPSFRHTVTPNDLFFLFSKVEIRPDRDLFSIILSYYIS